VLLAATEETTSIPAWTVLAIAGACLAAAIYLAYAIQRYGGRERALRRVAASQGLRFSDSDPAGIGSVRFPTFARARGVRVSNVLWDRAAGEPAVARVFDFALFEERDASRDQRDSLDGLADELFGFDARPRTEVTRVYAPPRTGAIVRVDAFLPPCSITPAGLMSRTFETMGIPDLDFESDAFNRGWDVRCGDNRFAQLFIDAQLIDLVLGLGEKVGLETFGNYVLFTSRFASPAKAVQLLRTATRLPAILSPLVMEEYPTAAAMEARSSVSAWQARPDGRGGQY
jgi:hypothetical protein